MLFYFTLAFFSNALGIIIGYRTVVVFGAVLCSVAAFLSMWAMNIVYDIIFLGFCSGKNFYSLICEKIDFMLDEKWCEKTIYPSCFLMELKLNSLQFSQLKLGYSRFKLHDNCPILAGLAYGAMGSPSLAILNQYFYKHKSLANGVAMVGSASNG